MKCSISWDVRVTIVRCSGLERSRRGKMFYCNIRTPVHRIAIPKVMWLLYPKFWVQTFGIATLWTGVSVFCNLYPAFLLCFPLCVPRPRSAFYCHRSRFRSWSPASAALVYAFIVPKVGTLVIKALSNTAYRSAAGCLWWRRRTGPRWGWGPPCCCPPPPCWGSPPQCSWLTSRIVPSTLPTMTGHFAMLLIIYNMMDG